MQRRKGQRGELQAEALIREHTGWDVRRRVRQHDGDSDLVGIPGWSAEVKRHAKAPRASIRAWWAQTAEQAQREGLRPVLFFRQDRDEWRAVWAVELTPAPYEWTAEGSIAAWAMVARGNI